MKRVIWKLATVAALTLLAGVAEAGNQFDYCLVCHGANANGNLAIRAPKLSGMEALYMTRQLKNFAAGTRGVPADDVSGHEMRPVALRLEKEGVLDAAVQFIGTLDSRKPTATVRGDVQQGQVLYAACAECHGPKGEGNAQLQAPALAARSDWYLVTQLNNYRLGVRGTDARDAFGAQMRAAAGTLADDQAVSDVVAYINTLP